MSATSGVKQLHLIQRNARWWNTPLTTQEKLTYYGFIAGSVVRAVSTKQKRVRYLGNILHYDNAATPLSLQAYPYEINNSILSNTQGAKLKRVLDIGGNIGQFSLTLSHALSDKAVIDVLEPNTEIFPLLKRNTAHKQNIRIHNYGVGRPGVKHMFYTPGKSATGSLFKENTSVTKRAKRTKIALVDDIAKLTGCDKYDLTKIDVEGYEYNMLKTVKKFQTKLLFIEVSSLGRYKNFSHSSLLSLIEKKFGKFDILHLSGGHAKSENFDILLRFVN